MNVYLAAAPGRLNDALRHTSYLAHAAYSVTADGHLAAEALPPQLRGGLLHLSVPDTYGTPHPEPLVREILQECRTRNYSGIVLDPAPSADCAALIRAMDRSASAVHRQLFVPEAHAAHATHASVLICTALSGGSLRQRLEEACAAYGPERVALDCQRLAMDFTLPAPAGRGAPLSAAQLRSRLAGRSVFFSSDLCARYVTYRTGTTTHFVLFDDADTLHRKVQLGEELGIPDAFFMLPEIEDLLDRLFPVPDPVAGLWKEKRPDPKDPVS